MNSYQLEELIRNIQNMIRCPNCGSSYKKEDIHFLGQLNKAVLVQMFCYVCKMPITATIVISGTSPVSGIPNFKKLESVSDKNIEEPISSDEILEMHNFLENFSGDFESLFKI